MDETPFDADDCRTQKRGKKKLNAALDRILRGQEALHDRLDDIALARLINRVHNAPVIAAWDVSSLPDEWIDAFVGLAIDLPGKQARQRTIKSQFDKFEREHPNYGKRFH